MASCSWLASPSVRVRSRWRSTIRTRRFFWATDDAEPGHGLGREQVVGRLGQHGDLLDGIGVRAQRLPDAVAEILGGVGGVHGDREVTADRRHRRDRVAPYKKLRAIRFTDQVPRSPAGKLLRRALVEAERAGTG
jgi:hypothetical protein